METSALTHFLLENSAKSLVIPSLTVLPVLPERCDSLLGCSCVTPGEIFLSFFYPYFICVNKPEEPQLKYIQSNAQEERKSKPQPNLQTLGEMQHLLLG